MKIRTYIMHHPSRPFPDTLAAIMSTIGHASFATDLESKGAWWNARSCWLEGSKAEHAADWIVVLHDDAEPAPGAAASVESALAGAQRQNVPIVSFFSCLPQYAQAVPYALRKGALWVETATGCAGLALAMRPDVAACFVDWCDRYIRDDWKADDTRVALFAAATRIWIRHTAPALFQHPREGAGIEGGKNKGAHHVAKGPLFGWAASGCVRAGTDKEQVMYLRARLSKFVPTVAGAVVETRERMGQMTGVFNQGIFKQGETKR
jgi:hypothetical protein